MDGRYKSAEARQALEAEAASRFHKARSADTDAAWNAVYEWIGQDAAHGVAFVKAEASWEISGRLCEIPHICDVDADETLSASHEIEPDNVDRSILWASTPDNDRDTALPQRGYMPPIPTGWVRRAFLGLMAASVIGTAGVAFWQFENAVDRYGTSVGQMRTITLSDGSVIRLNTNSAVEVALRPDRRLIRLLKGEARFDVAKDKKRPFLVQAGSTTVRAVGTAFNVRLKPELTELTVIEGVVSVGDGVSSSRKLSAGRAAAIRGGAIAVTPIEPGGINQRMAWEGGKIELDGATLAQAVEEFNRYRKVPLVIADPAISGLRIGGTFLNDGSDDFVAALKQSFDIDAVEGRDSILLVAAE
ncbi:MAG: transcriptional regulator [Sphingobium sp.]|nr:transcriptional regulator [Sphingobium sp.]